MQALDGAAMQAAGGLGAAGLTHRWWDRVMGRRVFKRERRAGSLRVRTGVARCRGSLHGLASMNS